MTKDLLRTAVIGTGSLGKEHARIYAELARAEQVEFIGVFDTNEEASKRIAERYSVKAYPSFEAILKEGDAFSIVTPTSTHFEIGIGLLEAGKHLLIEKPMTRTTEEAARLVERAHHYGCILQVGHVERFNPVLTYLEKVATHPKFIEAHRLSPYPGRSVDIGVVLDLMIHDLDIVLSFVKSPVRSVDAVGISVLSQTEDIANARIRFANGCVANLTASRVSPERMRKIRVFSGGDTTSYVSLDYRAQEGFIYRMSDGTERESSLLKKLLAGKHATVVSEFQGKRIVREPVPIEKEESLKLEICSFVDCVRECKQPLVSGESAKSALDLALEIARQIAGQQNEER